MTDNFGFESLGCDADLFEIVLDFRIGVQSQFAPLILSRVAEGQAL